MAQVNLRVSCAVPIPVPMVTCTCDPHRFTHQKQSKISQNSQDLSELWSKHSQCTVLIITHSILNCFGTFLAHFSAHGYGNSYPYPYPSLPIPMTCVDFVNLCHSLVRGNGDVRDAMYA